MNRARRNKVLVSGHWLFFCVLFSLVLVLSHGAEEIRFTNIGAIINVNSRTGKEEKTAMEIAVRSFNDASKHHKLTLHIQDSVGDPLQAATAAQEMIREKDVKVIIGMETWEEAALVADVGSKAQVPVLSFAAPSMTSQSAASRWPFLVRMATDDSEQMKCIAAVIGLFSWKRVTVIYEEDAFGSDSGKVAVLSEALQNVSAQIEHRLVLPPMSSVSDPKLVLQEELVKVQSTQSRVFVVLRTSLPTTIQLFNEARNVGLMGGDSAWIVTDTISSYLDSFNTSVIYSMEGTLGVKKYYFEGSTFYSDFHAKFMKNFINEFAEEHNPEPGINALIAYDSVNTVGQAINRLPKEGNNQRKLLQSILTSNFTGLSGEIRFNKSGLAGDPTLQLVNVVGKKYKELQFWLLGTGFSKSLVKNDSYVTPDVVKDLHNGIVWPAGSKRVPKGWAMPTEANPLVIVVPGKTSFEKFVKVESGKNPTGFCMDLFNEVLKLLDYDLPYRFEASNDTYENLVLAVYNKTYDAAIGDFTILANRTYEVEFTLPYAESGLSMIVPAKSEGSAWMFLKPFTVEMWLVTGGILIYTMLVVWFLENKTNPDFGGPLRRQFATALWFTCSSLFFAHREKVYSNFTRVVVIVWLFVVIVLSSSYTANLSSMLTVKRLESDVTDIDWLKRANKTIGCDGDSFVRNYLENVLNFPPQNIKHVSNEYSYEGEFSSGNITAAFLELPYAKVLINHYCKKFISTTATFRFGGLGFVFQKGSPIATDFSRAILRFSEDGSLDELENKWFAPSLECSANAGENETDRLTVASFWGLYLLSGATSTICFMLYLMRMLVVYGREERKLSTAEGDTLWKKVARVVKFLCFGASAVHGAASRVQLPDVMQGWGASSKWELVSPSEIAIGSRGTPTLCEVEMRIDI